MNETRRFEFLLPYESHGSKTRLIGRFDSLWRCPPDLFDWETKIMHIPFSSRRCILGLGLGTTDTGIYAGH